MEPIIHSATNNERRWAAELLAKSEPWIKLEVNTDQLLKTCFDPEFLVFIAHIEDKPCGVLIMDPRGIAGSPYIKSIAVANEFRRMGIGAQMVSFAESYFQDKSKHMFLCVSSFNLQAKSFYAGLGYNRVGEFMDYIIEGETEILMYKRIA